MAPKTEAELALQRKYELLRKKKVPGRRLSPESCLGRDAGGDQGRRMLRARARRRNRS